MNLILADIILFAHALYVGFVVLSVPLIMLGKLCRWHWVHNMWFRLTHLAMIGFVVFEVFISMTCPLTTWEHDLREQASTHNSARAAPDEQGFIAHWVGKALFHSYPHWVFNTLYISFGVIVLSLCFFVPIQRKTKPLTQIDHKNSSP